MTDLNDEHWMSRALAKADQAAALGDVPVGAVVVQADGRCLSEAKNEREIANDPTAHAEILALRGAGAARGHWRLEDCTLYVTLEPCPMCAGALVNSRIQRVVYGAADPKAGALGSIFNLADDERLNHRFSYTAGVQADAARQQLQSFFQRLRAEGQK